MNGGKRRIWEFQKFTICRLLGFAFDENEAERIVRKLYLTGPNGKILPYERHGVLVYICSKPNDKSAKYVEKILEQRFESYNRILTEVDQKDICEFLEGNLQLEVLKGIPIAALIWFAAREPRKDVVEIEQRIFDVIHTLDHRTGRFYESLTNMFPQGKPEDLLGELKQARKNQVTLEQKLSRLEQKKECLKIEIEQLKKDKTDLVSTLAEQRRDNNELKKLLERLGGESALEHIDNLEKERELLASEVKALTDEMAKRDSVDMSARPETAEACSQVGSEIVSAMTYGAESKCDALPSLKGTRIAFVGGLESLSPHYQEMVEQLGGIFCGHDGRCVVKGDLNRVIRRSDVVFCPVNPNSHNACRQVKKMCKYSGKPCCFLRNASLSMFRKELIQYARSLS